MNKKRAGEIGRNYATLLNISKSKKDLREKAKPRKGAGVGIVRYGRWEIWPLPPFPLSPKECYYATIQMKPSCH